MLAADCVWLPELVQPLVDTLSAVCRHVRGCPACAECHGHVRALLAYKSRSKRVDRTLFTALEQAGFSVEAVREMQGESRGSIQMWQARLRAS